MNRSTVSRHDCNTARRNSLDLRNARCVAFTGILRIIRTNALCSLALGLAMGLAVVPSGASADSAEDAPILVAGVQAGFPVHCAAWGGSICLPSDPSFDADLARLGTSDVGRPLLESAATSGVQVLKGTGDMPASTAAFFKNDNSVRIGTAVQGWPESDRLAILAHELQHAADFASGVAIDTSQGCYTTEQDAVTTETHLWQELFGDALPSPLTAYEAWLNTATRSPDTTAGTVFEAYRAECDRGLSGM